MEKNNTCEKCKFWNETGGTDAGLEPGLSERLLTSLAEVSQDDRTMAMLAHLSCFVLPITGPLILFLVKKDTSPFAAYHAMQALVYQAITGEGLRVSQS